MPDTQETLRRPLHLAEEIVKRLVSQGKMISLAESCTAGLVSDCIACVPGASGVLWGSFVTYTADAKTKMLGVPDELIKAHGAVSRPVALAMAEGALEKSGVSWAFSVTGLAGPGGDETDTPVGTVWIGSAGRNREPAAKVFHFSGSRGDVREAAARAVLEEVLENILTAEE